MTYMTDSERDLRAVLESLRVEIAGEDEDKLVSFFKAKLLQSFKNGIAKGQAKANPSQGSKE